MLHKKVYKCKNKSQNVLLRSYCSGDCVTTFAFSFSSTHTRHIIIQIFTNLVKHFLWEIFDWICWFNCSTFDIVFFTHHKQCATNLVIKKVPICNIINKKTEGVSSLPSKVDTLMTEMISNHCKTIRNSLKWYVNLILTYGGDRQR